MNELRIELVGGRRRVGLTVEMAAKLSGVWELHIRDFENSLGLLSPDEIEKLRTLYADMDLALMEATQFPNLWDYDSAASFLDKFRQRREARKRQREFQDSWLINSVGRRDPEKVRTHEAATAAEASQRMLEKARNIVSGAKAEIDYLTK